MAPMTEEPRRGAIFAHAVLLPEPLPRPYPMAMPTAARRWTAQMVRELPDDGNRYEVVDGVLLVTPSPSSSSG